MTWTRTFPARAVAAPEPEMLRKEAVSVLTGIPLGSITYLIAAKGFPKPYRPNQRVSLWDKSEVLAWLTAQLASRKTA